MNFIHKTIAVIGISALAACSNHTIKDDPNTYTKQDLQKATIFPTKEQLSGDVPRVVIFETELDADLAKKAKASIPTTTTVEGIIRTTGAQIIDRSLAKKLENQIKLAETKGTAKYEGPNIADFAIVPHISTAKSSSTYIESSSYKGGDGKDVRIPAKCIHKAEVTGHINIYELPTMAPVARIEIDGDSRQSEESKNSTCSYNSDNINNLVAAASQEAVQHKTNAIKNQFRPMGYVVEVRKSPSGKVLIKTTLGKKHGAAEKVVANIISKRSYKSNVTGKDNIANKIIGKAIISNIIQDNYSWIILDEKASKTDQIAMGDTVQVEFKDSAMDTIGKAMNSDLGETVTDKVKERKQVNH